MYSHHSYCHHLRTFSENSTSTRSPALTPPVRTAIPCQALFASAALATAEMLGGRCATHETSTSAYSAQPPTPRTPPRVATTSSPILNTPRRYLRPARYPCRICRTPGMYGKTSGGFFMQSASPSGLGIGYQRTFEKPVSSTTFPVREARSIPVTKGSRRSVQMLSGMRLGCGCVPSSWWSTRSCRRSGHEGAASKSAIRFLQSAVIAPKSFTQFCPMCVIGTNCPQWRSRRCIHQAPDNFIHL